VPIVSRRHAMIEPDGQHYILRDHMTA